MVELSDETLREVVQAIVREVDPEQIVLFGSRARGEARASSDLDLLIVEGPAFRADRTRWGEIRRIRRALSGFRVPKDILVYSKDEVAKWRGSVNHIIAGGLREGRVLYERS